MSCPGGKTKSMSSPVKVLSRRKNKIYVERKRSIIVYMILRSHDILVISYSRLIYNYLCNQCLSPLKFKSCSWRDVLDTTLCDKVASDLLQVGDFPPGTPISSTNKTDRHNITETLTTRNQPQICEIIWFFKGNVYHKYETILIINSC